MARYGRRRSLGFLDSPTFVLAVLPYLVLTAVLPVFGVLFNGYPERTLLATTDATTSASFLVLGAAASSHAKRSWAPWLLVAIALQLAYTLGQAVYWARGPGWELFTPFAQWDISLAALDGQLGSLGRSSGLYTNPNELGLWAGVAVILAWEMLPPRVRGVGITLAILQLLLSQSRGAAVALAAALVVGAVLSVARGRPASSTAFKAILSFGFAGLLAGLLALLIGHTAVLFDRFGAIFQVLTSGFQADTNLAARFDLWSGVLTLNSAYPWGTWGPPSILLGAAVDNAWFSALAQGSVPYVAALALLLGGALTLHRSSHGDTLRLVAVLVAVAGLTQSPSEYAVVALFWVLLGDGLQSSFVARAPLRCQTQHALSPACRDSS